MNSNCEEWPPRPSQQHEQILAKVGEWDIECSYFMDPNSEPLRANGHESVRALGKFWSTGHFHCDVGSTSIAGLSTTGFDPAKNKFVGTWQDSSTPYLYTFEGNLDGSGILVMNGLNLDPQRRQQANYRSVEQLGENERSLQLFVEMSKGEEFKILEYHYRRQS